MYDHAKTEDLARRACQDLQMSNHARDAIDDCDRYERLRVVSKVLLRRGKSNRRDRLVLNRFGLTRSLLTKHSRPRCLVVAENLWP